MLRLPYAVKRMCFSRWLDDHAPTKKARVVDRLMQLRGGKLYDDDAWGERMRGKGLLAEQMRALFTVSARRAGLNQERTELSTAHFRRPGGVQLEMF